MERETVTGANWSVTTPTWLGATLLYLTYFPGRDGLGLAKHRQDGSVSGLHTQSFLSSLLSVILQNAEVQRRFVSLNLGRETWAGEVNKERSRQPAAPSSKVNNLQPGTEIQHWWTKSVIINARGFSSQLHSVFRSMSTRPHLSAILH